jgi:lysosomal acid lipase/cholesteryl ester hydrolase
MLNFAVDTAVLHLLAFKNDNITKTQKLVAYPHLYCVSSVKSVVHWTQIMKHREFVPFHQHDHTGVDRYPTENITTPIALIHGDSDSLSAIESILERLPNVTRFELKGYEHIDVIWGKNVHIDVIPKVLAILQNEVHES